jgi:hypothetical protein
VFSHVTMDMVMYMVIRETIFPFTIAAKHGLESLGSLVCAALVSQASEDYRPMNT